MKFSVYSMNIFYIISELLIRLKRIIKIVFLLFLQKLAELLETQNQLS